MVNSPFTVFVSAWRQDSELFDNLKRQALLAEVLANHGYGLQPVLGRYGSDNEQAYAVPVHTLLQADNIARHAGAIYGQQCVGLLTTSDGMFELVYPSGKRVLVGNFTEVSEAEAQREPSATFWHGIWWVAK